MITEGHTHTMDLADVAFCDSTGLATLSDARRPAERAGAHLRVRAVERDLARIMAITGVEHLFALPPTDRTAGRTHGGPSGPDAQGALS